MFLTLYYVWLCCFKFLYSSILPGESQGRWSLVGCRLWGRTGSDTTEAMQQPQQHGAKLHVPLKVELSLFIFYLFIF